MGTSSVGMDRRYQGLQGQAETDMQHQLTMATMRSQLASIQNPGSWATSNSGSGSQSAPSDWASDARTANDISFDRFKREGNQNASWRNNEFQFRQDRMEAQQNRQRATNVALARSAWSSALK
ncbi:hypothetical protein K9N68_37225 (plasmid) [Kovacikia minuta CCNUW1]|uniref:hypothetical protein n=1 Tax=Kovacikia minuta TaxID=2931930 RepID=UPI001CCB14D3|nr:hypothetical protein [Kovacikia minuta]UBF29855.1 hypothetical protein K9N68_37225 [Kovacikia minuta CCNUW1]